MLSTYHGISASSDAPEPMQLSSTTTGQAFKDMVSLKSNSCQC